MSGVYGIEPASPGPELIVVYVGQREDCGCPITEDEWDRYVALVTERVRADYPDAERLDVVETAWPGHAGSGAFVVDADGGRSAAADIRETIQVVWDAGRFWDPAELDDPA